MFPLFLLSANVPLMGVHRLTGFHQKVCWVLGFGVMAINVR